MTRLLIGVLLTASVAVLSGQGGGGQFPGGGRGRAGGPPAAPSNLPDAPTAVALPKLSAEVTGPGPMFDSTSSLAPGKGLPALPSDKTLTPKNSGFCKSSNFNFGAFARASSMETSFAV